jgi:copper chaperone NosL
MTFPALRRWRRLIVLALLAPLAAACEITPEPLHLGAEECAHCSMLITERRYAAQLLNARGKAFMFDAVECLRGFVQDGTVAAADIHSIWVTDAAAGDGWIAAEEAAFLHSPELRTPMGGGLAAYASAAAAAAAAAELNGVVMTWTELLASPDAMHGAAAHGTMPENAGHGAEHAAHGAAPEHAGHGAAPDRGSSDRQQPQPDYGHDH